MKDPSSPMDVCPYCSKAFKRLKSHLPHCKMAQTKNPTPETQSDDQSMTANLAPMKTAGTTLPNVEKQEAKVKGKKGKKEKLKSEVQQDKTMSSPRTTEVKKEDVTSEERLAKEKATATIEDSKEALQTSARTTAVVTSTKERGQDQVALTEPNAPLQQALVLRLNPEKMVPARVDSPRVDNTLLTVRDQAWTKDLERDRARLSIPKQDTAGSPVDHTTVRHQFQGQVHEQVHLDQSLVPRALSAATKAPMVIGWTTSIPQERIKTQVSDISPTVTNIEAEVCNNKALGTIRKSTKLQMDVPPPPKTVQIEPLQLDRPIGLQWVPQLYSSYVQLRVVPGRHDQWAPQGRGTKILEPMGRPPELCRSLEIQSTPKPLMDVRLGELPAWLANRRYSPKIIPQFIKNAWGQYYNKYINVRKGGVGGVSMLLAGYCVLSYTWNYDHIKQDRWRKYH